MNDHGFWAQFGEALLMAFAMFWDVGWSLVLGFTISAVIQALVPTEALRRAFGKDDARAIALATVAGAVSSSCSYASAAISRSLFKKDAALIPSLAFLFASTNLVIELGIILYLLMGWQFTAAEWIGGVVLVVIMTVLVRLTYPAQLVEEVRHHPESAGGHEHEPMVIEGDHFWDKLRKPEARIAIAQNFAMDFLMLWKDLLGGFLIAGFLSAFVPAEFWRSFFLSGASPWVRVPVNALLGPLVAIVTFVCSIGNVPMAAVLWASGISFGGVLAFLYADLIVLPLLDAYRRYYGWRMAVYIGVAFYATMVLASLVMDVAFTALGLVPAPNPNIRADLVQFSFNYTFWLNLIFGALAVISSGSTAGTRCGMCIIAVNTRTMRSTTFTSREPAIYECDENLLMRMFGRPQGIARSFGGRIMARMNADYGAWLVEARIRGGPRPGGYSAAWREPWRAPGSLPVAARERL